MYSLSYFGITTRSSINFSCFITSSCDSLTISFKASYPCNKFSYKRGWDAFAISLTLHQEDHAGVASIKKYSDTKTVLALGINKAINNGTVCSIFFIP